LLGCNSVCSCGWRLEYALRGAISNAIKGFGFPHWTPIGFQMRCSKARTNKQQQQYTIIVIIKEQEEAFMVHYFLMLGFLHKLAIVLSDDHNPKYTST